MTSSSNGQTPLWVIRYHFMVWIIIPTFSMVAINKFRNSNPWYHTGYSFVAFWRVLSVLNSVVYEGLLMSLSSNNFWNSRIVTS
jgi:magnesium-transporting ATPase (P-type)